MNGSPAVTIMIPAYNQANFLPVALESALAQDYKDLEVVVSDDGSGDGSEAVLQKYLSDKRVRYYRNERNLGRVANYRHTLENYAKGEWVVNLDADDYFTDPSFISKAIGYIMNNDQRQIVFLQAGHTIKTSEGKVIRTDIPAIGEDYSVIDGTAYFLAFNHFSHMATVFNRERALGLDFYRYDILSADIESFLRLALQGRVILMRKSIGVWLQHGSNESHRLSIPVVEKNMLRIEGPYIYAKSLGIFPEQVLLRWRNKMTNAYLLGYLTVSLKDKTRLKGYLGHALKYYPQIIVSTIIPKAILRAAVSKISRLLGIKRRKAI
jgi:glycosyltransferase involved in cell wall biosynthesis